MKIKRTLAIGDVHGCSKPLSKLLKRVNLDKATTVILMGDYCDRGPDSKGVLDLIMQLQQDGYDIRCCRGNHEEMLVTAASSGVYEDALEHLENGGKMTLRSFGVDHQSLIPVVYLDFMRSMPLFIETGTHIFVHGGLVCDLQKPISSADRHEMLWKRSSSVKSRYRAGKTVVTAHSVISLEKIRESLRTPQIRLDNGCWLGAGYQGGTKGNLLALELETNELYVQPNIDIYPVA